MKIICDSCSAQYVLSDEKVPQKIFKIRCKQCGHFIVVNPAQKDPETLDDSDLVPSPSASQVPAGTWYVLVGQERQGPLSGAALQEKINRKEVDSFAYTWREGLADWVEIGTLAEWKNFFKSEKATPKLRSEEEDTQRWLPQEPKTGLRNENSVLFSLGDLQKGSGTSTPKLPPTPPSNPSANKTDSSGLVDIRALAAKTTAPKETSIKSGMPSMTGFQNNDAALPSAPTSFVRMPTSSGRKIPIWGWVLIGVLLVACSVLAWWNVSSRKKSPEPGASVAQPVARPTNNTVAPTVKPVVETSRPSVPSSEQPNGTDTPKTDKKQTGTPMAPEKVSPQHAVSSEKKQPETERPAKPVVPPTHSSPAESKPVEKSTPSAPKSAEKDKKGGSASDEEGWGGVLNAGSTMQQMPALLKSLESSAASECKAKLKGPASAKISLKITIAASGSILVMVADKPADEEAAVDCVRSKIKAGIASKKPAGENYSSSLSVTVSP